MLGETEGGVEVLVGYIPGETEGSGGISGTFGDMGGVMSWYMLGDGIDGSIMVCSFM